MSKLCQCTKDVLQYYFYLINPENVPQRTKLLSECIDVLQRDCVCKKKEEPNLIRIYLGKEEVGKVHLTDGFCVFGKEYRVEFEYNHAVKVMESWDENMKNKEKQSQSPCEHEWQQLFFNMPVNDQPGVVRRIQLPSWGCFKPNCGQVVCKNPNQ